jgi:hypothetical protein
MKTNFLYFRENGNESFTATAAQTAFTINGDANWDLDVTASTEVKVTVTFALTPTLGTHIHATTYGTPLAGSTITVNPGAITIAGDIITVENLVTDTTDGVLLRAGDVVNISLIADEGTEACFRADRLLSVHSNSDTVTEITFKASNGSAGDDTVILTHPDNDGAEFKIIADYIYQVCNANITERGGVITVWDKQNGVIGKGLAKAGVTKMLLAIA